MPTSLHLVCGCVHGAAGFGACEVPRHMQGTAAAAKSLQSCPNSYATVRTVAHQAPLSMGFSRQEYWIGLPCPPPGNLRDPGIEPVSLTSPSLAGGFFSTSATWEVLGP